MSREKTYCINKSKVEQALKNKNLLQKELADKIGMHPQALCRALKRGRISATFLNRIGLQLDLAPGCLTENPRGSDCIDRRAAITTAVSAAIDWHRLANPQYSIAYSIGEAMRALPSAQPEPLWIPCSEMLPREHTRVIGYMAWKAMTAIEYQHGKWYSIDHLEPLPDEAVSHWMPLPKPPKGGDE